MLVDYTIFVTHIRYGQPKLSYEISQSFVIDNTKTIILAKQQIRKIGKFKSLFFIYFYFHSLITGVIQNYIRFFKVFIASNIRTII